MSADLECQVRTWLRSQTYQPFLLHADGTVTPLSPFNPNPKEYVMPDESTYQAPQGQMMRGTCDGASMPVNAAVGSPQPLPDPRTSIMHKQIGAMINDRTRQAILRQRAAFGAAALATDYANAIERLERIATGSVHLERFIGEIGAFLVKDANAAINSNIGRYQVDAITRLANDIYAAG